MVRRLACALLLLVLVGSLLAAAPSSAPPTPLSAGVATVDITPELGKSTLGYVRPDITMEGVHTRLTARALVLDDGEGQPVVLVSTDLGFPLRKADLVARVADLGYTAATVVYHSSHTHSGPEDLDDWQVDQLARAIREAHASRVPVVAGWGTSQVRDVNRNRSVEAHLADHGMDLFEGQGHPQDDPRGEEHTRDTTVRVLRLDRVDGSGPLAAWTHFPVHLTTVTPANTLWDADLASPATWYLQQAVDAEQGDHDRGSEDAGFTALYANGAQGDLMPRFDSFNPQAVVDLQGRRLAQGAFRAWRDAGTRLSDGLTVDVRWTASCYCGQEVDDEGHRVSSEPVWGLPFLGGSEDGASIFMEALGTEGKRRPAELADPVHGRKLVVAPSRPVGVHTTEPEFAAIRVGDRVMLTVPGEPSVEVGRRLAAAARQVLPVGVTDAFSLGLANGYQGYLVTPEEYDQQHYEGGHTVFGKWTSLLALKELTALVDALDEPVAPEEPAAVETPEAVPPALGDGGVAGALVAAPEGRVERMDVVEVSWTGAAGGVDRPVDTPFVRLQREAAGRWVTEESDLGVAMAWTQDGDTYTVRIDLRRDLAPGRYRVRVTSGAYELDTDPFEVGPATDLVLRGAERIRRSDGRDWVRIVAQNPRPDETRAVLWRPVSAAGGEVTFLAGGRELTARWDHALHGWVAPLPPGVTTVTVPAGGLSDAYGNTTGASATLDLADGIGPADWPDNIGVGGGRTPGPGGQGSFPP